LIDLLNNIFRSDEMRTILAGLFLFGCVVGCADSATVTSDTATDDANDVVAVSETEVEVVEEEPAAEATNEVAAAGDVAPAVTQAVFNVGDPAPKFADLAGVDDKKHSLADFDEAKAIAVVFTCNTCPVAVAYEDRLEQYQKDYADKGVQLVAINVNNDDGNKLPAMKDRATEKGFTFPYLYDPTQKVARDYDAKVTPHVFLLDKQRKLAYVGPVDDNMDDATAAKPLLREATDAVLADQAPATTEVEPVGCGIKYE
jgi:peroxiredoxin